MEDFSSESFCVLCESFAPFAYGSPLSAASNRLRRRHLLLRAGSQGAAERPSGQG
jgi:hypothetical protein